MKTFTYTLILAAVSFVSYKVGEFLQMKETTRVLDESTEFLTSLKGS